MYLYTSSLYLLFILFSCSLYICLFWKLVNIQPNVYLFTVPQWVFSWECNFLYILFEKTLYIIWDTRQTPGRRFKTFSFGSEKKTDLTRWTVWRGGQEVKVSTFAAACNARRSYEISALLKIKPQSKIFFNAFFYRPRNCN